MNRVLVLLAAASLLGCTPKEPKAPPTTTRRAEVPPASIPLSTVSAAVTGYTQFRRMTPERMAVDIRLATQCMSVLPDQRADSVRRYGPHAQAYVNVYMTEAAAAAFERGDDAFPVGSVVVKEKFRGNASPDGIGGMIKRPAGYDADHGDWEYFYAEPGKPVDSGRIDSCVQCHTGAAASDYVFGQWAKDAEPRR